MVGTIKSVVASRGFGFIAPAESGADVFFHCSALRDGLEFDARLMELRVEYDEETDERSGRSHATNVRPAR